MFATKYRLNAWWKMESWFVEVAGGRSFFSLSSFDLYFLHSIIYTRSTFLNTHPPPPIPNWVSTAQPESDIRHGSFPRGSLGVTHRPRSEKLGASKEAPLYPPPPLYRVQGSSAPLAQRGHLGATLCCSAIGHGFRTCLLIPCQEREVLGPPDRPVPHSLFSFQYTFHHAHHCRLRSQVYGGGW